MASCRYCGQMHSPLRVCEEMRAAKGRQRPVKNASPNKRPDVANNSHDMANDVANAETGMANTSSTYRYRDEDARRTYQRDLMRKRRAEGRA